MQYLLACFPFSWHQLWSTSRLMSYRLLPIGWNIGYFWTAAGGFDPHFVPLLKGQSKAIRKLITCLSGWQKSLFSSCSEVRIIFLQPTPSMGSPIVHLKKMTLAEKWPIQERCHEKTCFVLCICTIVQENGHWITVLPCCHGYMSTILSFCAGGSACAAVGDSWPRSISRSSSFLQSYEKNVVA